MSYLNVSLGLAALAGVASFLSPCVLALVPAYVGYLGGRCLGPKGEVVRNRWVAFSHGIAFVLGFSSVFIALGAAASTIGALLYDVRAWLARAGGIAVIIFGLHTLGVINIPFLDFDLRSHKRPDPGLGYFSSFLMGVFFSAGWSPCVGPVLGAVLTIAMNTAMLGRGVILLAAYSLGMAIPFLLTALGIGRLTELLRRHGRVIRAVSMGAGAVLIVLGVMLLTGTLGRLSQFGFFVDLGL
jgi:cytochrome c-type biogenesis protein